MVDESRFVPLSPEEEAALEQSPITAPELSPSEPVIIPDVPTLNLDIPVRPETNPEPQIDFEQQLVKNIAEQSVLGDMPLFNQIRSSILESVQDPEKRKDLLVAAGAMFGGGLPGVVGGGLAKIFAGSVLGAAGGRAAEGVIRQEPVEKQLQAIQKEAELEAMFSGGFLGAGAAIKSLGPYVGKLFGVSTPEAKNIKEIADSMNIPFGVSEVTKSRILRGFPGVVGVFPFVSGPSRKAQQQKGRALLKARDDILNSLAPNMTLYNLGVDVTTAAKNTYKEFKTIDSALWEYFYDLAKQNGNPLAINTNYIKQSLSGGRESIQLRRGQTLEAPVASEALRNYVKKLELLPDRITFTQLEQIKKDLNSLYSRSLTNPDKELIRRVKLGLETAMNNFYPDVFDPDVAEELINVLNVANGFHAAGMMTFQNNPIAKKFQRVDRNFFQAGPFKAGSITPAEIGKILIKTKDPESIKDLKKIIPQEEFQKIARAYIQNAADRATVTSDILKDPVFDFYKFEKNLGLDTPEGTQTLLELLRDSPVSIDKVRNLIILGKTYGTVDIADAARFLKRRFILGGIRSLNAAAGVGATTAAPESLFVSIPGLIMFRYFDKMLTSPKVLTWMTKSLDDTAPEQLRRLAMANLSMWAAKQMKDEEKEKVKERIQKIGRENVGSAL